MKPIAPSLVQWKLPLLDLPSLALPEQQELARALKEFLVQAARQSYPTASCPSRAILRNPELTEKGNPRA